MGVPRLMGRSIGMTFNLTNSNLTTARNWVEHNEARMRELLRTNHAGVVEWPCRGGCGRMFDVGYERLIHPAFNPVCFDCHESRR